MRLNLVLLLSIAPAIALAMLVLVPHFEHAATAQSSTSFKDENATAPKITIQDTINSTYAISDPKSEESEKAIIKAVKDRLIDLVHTVAARNATITSSGTITNDSLKESITVNNNYTRIIEVLTDQLEMVLGRTNNASQASNVTQIHTETKMTCISNGTAQANCDIAMKIR
jgi:hypothetical protein